MLGRSLFAMTIGPLLARGPGRTADAPVTSTAVGGPTRATIHPAATGCTWLPSIFKEHYAKHRTSLLVAAFARTFGQ
jgi:hypothetical protein